MVWELLAVLAAAFNALGSVLQRRGASRVPESHTLGLRIVVDLLRSPAAVGGVLALIVGVALQAAALNGAPITLVEPIMVAELPFTLLLAALALGARIERATWAAVLLTATSLGGLLAAAQPSGGSVARADALAWAGACAGTCGAVALLIVLARRISGQARAAALAVASGTGHGLSVTLMKAATVAAAGGVGSLFGAWQLYAMIFAGACGVYLYQNALQAGTLAAAQPALSIGDPTVSACLGVTLFGESVRGGAYLAAELPCLVGLVVGVLLLARAQLVGPAPSGECRHARGTRSPASAAR